MMYYHGSKKLIKGGYLTPRKSKIINGEKAVFATNMLYWAIFFISDNKDCDVESGYWNRIPYMLENYPGALNKFFSNISGYIYEVDSKHFHNDKRLGLQEFEFISNNRVKILKRNKIPDILKALKKQK